MGKVKDLALMYESRWDDTLTGDVSITNILAKSEGLTSMSFTLSQKPLRKIVFQFPPLSDTEDYTAVITLPRKPVVVEPTPEPLTPAVEPESVEGSEPSEPSEPDIRPLEAARLKLIREDPKELRNQLLNEITEIQRKRKVKR